MVYCDHRAVAVKSSDGFELVFLIVSVHRTVHGKGVAAGIVGGCCGVGEGGILVERVGGVAQSLAKLLVRVDAHAVEVGGIHDLLHEGAYSPSLCLLSKVKVPSRGFSYLLTPFTNF